MVPSPVSGWLGSITNADPMRCIPSPSRLPNKARFIDGIDISTTRRRGSEGLVADMAVKKKDVRAV